MQILRNPCMRGCFLILMCCVQTSRSGAGEISLEKASISHIHAAYKKGSLSAGRLVDMCLARIEAYEDRGPSLNSLILVNPKAKEEAAACDRDLAGGSIRGPLHGIPIILKDNHDTFDMPTTGGSVFLEGSIPPDDAFIVKKLRDAAAIILAKANLSEFASSAKTNGFSSLGGQTRNPHDLERGPSGSSGGSGAAVAAWYAPLALGTDTGGSIRNPCAANGVAGIKPTRGLWSRDGIIPLGLSFDTSGPMGKNIYDVALALGAAVGMDSADPETAHSAGKFHLDYTQFLKTDALKGARLGVFTDYSGSDPGVREVFKAAQEMLESSGATLIDISLPGFIMDRQSIMNIMRPGEFKVQVGQYLTTLSSGYPKSLAELIVASGKFSAKPGWLANPSRWEQFKTEQAGYDLQDPIYLSASTHGPALIAGHLQALLFNHNLDAFIYPTNPVPAQRLDHDYSQPRSPSATSIANITGFPDVIVPAGMTPEKLPVTLSFLGSAFSEPKLLALAYAFEQAYPMRAAPESTPALPGENFSY